jgi:two-component system, chemotaxis family, chemotaxis protein CheY
MDINKKRVLIVDDENRSRMLFDALMTSLGFETVLANDGVQAIEILSRDPYFDLIITDITISAQSGFDFIGQLKHSAKFREIPVIATSTFNDWKKAKAEKEFTMDGFVPKPVTKNILKNEIEKVLGD